MRKITIPFNTDLMSVRDIKIMVGVMSDMINQAYNMRDDHKNIPEEEYLWKCHAFFRNFNNSVRDISTYTIEDTFEKEHTHG